MKKIILLAAFGVAGLVSANGTTSKKIERVILKKEIKAKKPLRLCGVSVVYYDSAGNIKDVKFLTSDQPTLETCQNWQRNQVAAIQQAGYSISQL
ncbi:hypothetical protein [Chryseobacterium wangxinyae]|uniref:hypothetical protein n=1 Tax=Chryseobacterium sp. CY353 TaxID=2997334 RepID=UPI00226F90E4|nr:hypothetical protein [Chryseobacterium sp. CY353]MCY0967995.1 hypothetical protein [Chryseobacterium sp. CY353]